MTATPRILVVDDDPEIRKLLDEMDGGST